MADISDVGTSTIKDLYERLESLSCMSLMERCVNVRANSWCSSNYDQNLVLILILFLQVFELFDNNTGLTPMHRVSGKFSFSCSDLFFNPASYAHHPS